MTIIVTFDIPIIIIVTMKYLFNKTVTWAYICFNIIYDLIKNYTIIDTNLHGETVKVLGVFLLICFISIKKFKEVTEL